MSRHRQPVDRLAFDIFCQVIDNFGDIGVCWRLARQLAQAPYRLRVRLWVDDLHSFKRLASAIRPELSSQTHCNVDIIRWTDRLPDVRPHPVVIEAFGCPLPAAFIEGMAQADSLWLNLEYLSAEPWVERFHGQPSIQAGGIRKFFFFPGFTDKTGGLLREHGLLERRAAWRRDYRRRHALLRSLGVSCADIESLTRGGRLWLLFCYPDAPVMQLLDFLANGDRDALVLIPEGVYPQAPASHQGRLRTYTIPFVDQDVFDQLLWSADVNVVRGEDSLVRALWAARPFLWQPYPQSEGTHLLKLNAWLARSPFCPRTKTLLQSWSKGESDVLVRELAHQLRDEPWTAWEAQCGKWCDTLAGQADLASALLDFCTQHR